MRLGASPNAAAARSAMGRDGAGEGLGEQESSKWPAIARVLCGRAGALTEVLPSIRDCLFTTVAPRTARCGVTTTVRISSSWAWGEACNARLRCVQGAQGRLVGANSRTSCSPKLRRHAPVLRETAWAMMAFSHAGHPVDHAAAVPVVCFWRCSSADLRRSSARVTSVQPAVSEDSCSVSQRVAQGVHQDPDPSLLMGTRWRAPSATIDLWTPSGCSDETP